MSEPQHRGIPDFDSLEFDPVEDSLDEKAYAKKFADEHPDTFAHYMKRRWVVFVVAYVGYVCAYLVRNNFKLQSEAIRLENGWELTQIGLILTAFTITYGFAKFFMGMVSDRMSLRRIFAGCLGISAVIAIAMGFTHNYVLLFILMLLLGTVQGALAPSSMAMIANWYPNRSRGSGIAIWNTSQNLGGAGLPLILTWIATLSGGTATMLGFLIPGLLVLTLSFAFWKWGGDRPEDEGMPRLSTIYGPYGEPSVEEVPEEGYMKTFVRFVLTSPVVLLVAQLSVLSF